MKQYKLSEQTNLCKKHIFRHSLTIQSVRREDYGKYACHASSIKGAAEKTIEISGLPQR
jgi:hypothetical protein